jgi:hypothetical protein
MYESMPPPPAPPPPTQFDYDNIHSVMNNIVCVCVCVFRVSIAMLSKRCRLLNGLLMQL